MLSIYETYNPDFVRALSKKVRQDLEQLKKEGKNVLFAPGIKLPSAKELTGAVEDFVKGLYGELTNGSLGLVSRSISENLESYIDSTGQIVYERYSPGPQLQAQYRDYIKPGMKVMIVLKKDQRSGKLTEGIVEKLLTSKRRHTRGIKVRLTSGQVGRVQQILDEE